MSTRSAALALLTACSLATPAFAQPAPTPAAAAVPANPPVPAQPVPAQPQAAPAKPSILMVVSDVDASLTIKLATTERKVDLKKGENRVELPQGHFTLLVDPAKVRAEPAEGDLTESGGELRIVLTTLGRVDVALPGEDGRIELDGKTLPAKDGKVHAEVPAGPHSLIVRRPGHFGAKGSVDVAPGRTTAVTAQMEKFEGTGNKTLAWVGIIGGGALVVGAIAVDAFGKYDEIGGDATRWTLLGLGAVGFVGGTILLKGYLDEDATPPVKDARFDVKVAVLPGGALAQVGGKF